jgi:hypothetical protein
VKTSLEILEALRSLNDQVRSKHHPGTDWHSHRLGRRRGCWCRQIQA